jgi:two-component system chemotaxis response regulator CheY
MVMQGDRAAEKSQEEGASMKRTVLMVEDCLTTAHLQEFALKVRDFEVETARDGMEALEKLYQDPEKFDLLIADLVMPRMDGLTLVRKLRQHETFRDLPIVILTSEYEEESKRESLRAGADLYLTKPTGMETLVAHMEMLLGGSRGWTR